MPGRFLPPHGFLLTGASQLYCARQITHAFVSKRNYLYK